MSDNMQSGLFELRLRCALAEVEAVSDALEALDALSRIASLDPGDGTALDELLRLKHRAPTRRGCRARYRAPCPIGT